MNLNFKLGSKTKSSDKTEKYARPASFIDGKK